MNPKFMMGVVLAAVAAVVSPACSYRLGAASDPAMIFEEAARHVLAGTNGAVRMDSRIMDSVPTRFDYERDVHRAPTPTLVPLPHEERQRKAILARLGVLPERIEDYAACTPYIGGVPIRRPGETPAWRAAADSARTACAPRERYGIAILGLPRRETDRAAWKIRVYLVTAESRQVYDLVLAEAGSGAWSVIGREELLTVSS
jgi:hypothetical protein